MYEVPSREDVGQVIITRETVIDNVNPTIVPRTQLDEGPEEKSA
ncbi:ATP-dependent Clp protease ATP-binding subunit ClpX, partial [Nocardiopsis sp. NPDC050513]